MFPFRMPQTLLGSLPAGILAARHPGGLETTVSDVWISPPEILIHLWKSGTTVSDDFSA